MQSLVLSNRNLHSTINTVSCISNSIQFYEPKYNKIDLFYVAHVQIKTFCLNGFSNFPEPKKTGFIVFKIIFEKLGLFYVESYSSSTYNLETPQSVRQARFKSLFLSPYPVTGRISFHIAITLSTNVKIRLLVRLSMKTRQKQSSIQNEAIFRHIQKSDH